MLQLLYDPLQLLPFGGVDVLALLHHVPGQLVHVSRGLEVLAELDALPFPFLLFIRDEKKEGISQSSVALFLLAEVS